MSPEQCRGEPLDRRSDIFALGVVLYELTTRRRLFAGANDFVTMERIVRGDVAPPSAHDRGYPRELEQIVLRALSRDAAARYPTAQAMQNELELFAREHKLSISTISLSQTMRELFGERAAGWKRALKLGRPLADHIVATLSGVSGDDVAHRSVATLDVDQGKTSLDPSPTASAPRRTRLFLLSALTAVLGLGAAFAVRSVRPGARAEAAPIEIPLPVPPPAGATDTTLSAG
jgi:serine/threonine-protein kinase